MLEGGSRVGPGTLSLVVCAGVLGTDVVLKLWAEYALTEPVFVTSWFCLALRHNSGLFLGALPVASVALAHWFILSAAIVWLGWRMTSAGSLAAGAGYGLVAGGVIGNALDRIDGAAVDYLGIGPVVDHMWAFVNFADLAMFCGALLLGLALIRGRPWSPLARDRNPKEPASYQADASSSTSGDVSP